MTEKLSLKKRSETVKLSLKKSGVVRDKVILRVAAALDISGSMQNNYASGRVSDLVDRLLPVADQFDDNGEIDMWLFNTTSREAPPATPSNYGGYVQKELRGVDINGGTYYAPVIKDIAHHYFGEESTAVNTITKAKGFFGKLFGSDRVEQTVKVQPVTESDIPALVFFISDGEAGDTGMTDALMTKLRDEKVYWVMIGIGNNKQFAFMRDLSNKYENVSFINFDNLDLSDEEIYNSIINSKLANWINKIN